MKTFNLKQESFLWIFLIAPVVYFFTIVSQLPAIVPNHFNYRGEADGWGSKWTLLLGPALAVIVYLLLFFLPAINPKRISPEFIKNNFYKIRVVMGVFLCVLSIYLIYTTKVGSLEHGGRWLAAMLFLLFALLGNFMISMKPNWFIGIRTPWTLSSEKVWRQTHVVGGRVWFYGGLLGFAFSLFIDKGFVLGLLITFALGSAVLLSAYSFWLYKQEQRESNHA